ncbi:RluA family pseudouridine synthase [Treponema primitia]|uniref:RluA family pseudouridine synthase n=1 Tax=Treponema primitia TaxID=88058 RepID=UPI0002554E6A|nr:RluA family pseudouridine synthase [Treponema primitia]
MKNITVLFENDQCMVLNKPAGLAVQGGEGVGTSLDSLLSAEYSPRPLLVHRLDKDTSGVILVAKTKEAAALFAGIFARPVSVTFSVQKQYLAVCAGRPTPESGTIETDLEIRGAARKAKTSYRRINGVSHLSDFSLLELELGTGRMHQIRRHLASIGHPILGDDKYGDFALNKRLRKERGLKRLLLHASRLVIPEGLCGFTLDVSAPLPEYFGAFLEGS